MESLLSPVCTFVLLLVVPHLEYYNSIHTSVAQGMSTDGLDELSSAREFNIISTGEPEIQEILTTNSAENDASTVEDNENEFGRVISTDEPEIMETFTISAESDAAIVENNLGMATASATNTPIESGAEVEPDTVFLASDDDVDDELIGLDVVNSSRSNDGTLGQNTDVISEDDSENFTPDNETTTEGLSYEDRILGCFKKKPRVVIPTFSAMNIPLSIFEDRPVIGICIRLCRAGISRTSFTFAMWLPKDPFRQHWDCYCTNDLLTYYEQIATEDCGPTNRTLALAYITCPLGHYAPPACTPRCPVYCEYGSVGEPHCYDNGTCLFGCQNDTCSIEYECQLVTGTPDFGGMSSFKDSFRKRVDPGLLIFLDLQAKVSGWLHRIRYSSHGNNEAYLSSWRLYRTSMSWQLIGKLKLFPNASSDFLEVPKNETFYVEEGDYFAIHHDATAIPMGQRMDIQQTYTLFHWYIVDDMTLPYFTAETVKTGVYMASALLDDKWRPGQVFSSSSFTYSNITYAPKVYPDIDLVLACHCNDWCDGSLCEHLGESQCETSCRVGYLGAGPCQPCASGRYGINCENSCVGCKDELCNPSSGVCIHGCGPDYIGALCDKACPAGLYGLECTLNCSKHCVDGVCTSEGCACLPGFSPPMCTESCPPGYWGNCSLECGRCYNEESCDPETGLCEACSSGYLMPFCTTICPMGFYGYNCSVACGNCSGGFPCHPATGYCPAGCMPGLQPPYCEGGCRKGHFGNDCSGYCDYCYQLLCERDGRCISLCAAGLKPPDCKQVCDAGSYGLKCARTCGQCADDAACHPATGVCPLPTEPGKSRCVPRFWGPQCVWRCGECYKQAACDEVDGACPNGWCVEETLPRPRCTRFGMTPGVCSPGFYGPGCALKCGKCINDEACNSTYGKCPNGCEIGLMPPMCASSCKKGYYGMGCTLECGFCRYREPCHPETGVCVECGPGYLLPHCTAPCKLGYYGLECKFECGACDDYAPCDPVTGACPGTCIEGYVGQLCKFLLPEVPGEVRLVSNSAIHCRTFPQSLSNLVLVYVTCLYIEILY